MGCDQVLLGKLKRMLSALSDLEIAETEFYTAEGRLHSNHNPMHLKHFDDMYLENYVEARIGKKPEAPGKLKVLLLPLYLKQKAQYEAAMAEYNDARPMVEEEYRKEYWEQREALRIQDENEETKNTEEAEKQYHDAENRLSFARKRVEEDDTVASTLKKKEIIEKLILYLEEGRADTWKEAINLYYDEIRKAEEAQKEEDHRRKMLELEKEKVRAAQAAEEYAEKQLREAQRASQYAQRAAELNRSGRN